MMTGKPKRPRSWNRNAFAPDRGPQGRFEQSSAAFTLVELLLTIVLVLLLFGAAVFNFSSLRQGADLNEGTARLETFLRLARAYAAESGCKVQLYFAEATTNESSSIHLQWEPAPLTEPGVWIPVSGTGWNLQDLNEMIRVVSVQSPAAAATVPGPLEPDEATESAMPERPPLVFYPDGTSESADLIIAARDPEDPRRLIVQINGFTGAIRRRSVVADQLAPAEAAPISETPVSPLDE